MAEQLIDIQQVEKVARLSRLAIPAEQLPKFTQQLESILEYIAQLKSADVSAVEPMAHAVKLTNVLRDDVPAEPLSTEDVLRNAPATDGPFFKVPKVLGDDDSAG
jgi:aspartyl-tRNA(Asn)/glutamyl-tRNA(Gln) amidotransferase subunit C